MNGGNETPIQALGFQIHLELCLTQDSKKGDRQNPAGEN